MATVSRGEAALPLRSFGQRRRKRHGVNPFDVANLEVE
jgi:hypothetical protein